MNTEELELITSQLKESPMFRLSLSSKELFHSNFLHWIWEVSPKMFRDVINCITKGIAHSEQWPDGYVVAREHKHYDLSVWDGKPKADESNVLLVLENKVKSIPNKKQLDEYYKDNRAKYVLLSLSKDFPEKEAIGADWCIVHYDDLAQALSKCLIKCDSMTGYYQEIIMDYCHSVQNLQELVTQSQISIEKTWAKSDFSNAFENLQIGDLYKKLRYGQILCYITEKLCPPCPIIWNYSIMDIFDGKKCGKKKRDCSRIPDPFQEIYVNYGMTNSQGFFEAKIKVSNDTVFLIQVQGNQYRRAIERKGTYKENILWLNDPNSDLHKFFSYTEKGTPDFEYSVSPEKISPFKPQKDPSQDGFCKFKDWFVYQYIKIEGSTTIESVVNAVIKDIEEVLNLNRNECCRPSL